MSWQSFLDVVIELEKLDLVSPQRVDLVEECLQGIGRWDLATKVSAYKSPGEAKVAVSSQARFIRTEKPTASWGSDVIERLKIGSET